MLIKPQDELSEILQIVKHEISRGTSDRKHPFRYVVLTTLGRSVASRYVVLREVDKDFRLLIYTDFRSEKIKHIQTNPEVQLLFYHSKKQTQIIISGSASIEFQNEFSRNHWAKVKGNADKSYTTSKPPGTPIAIPEEGHLWDETSGDKHFAVLRINPSQIEVLQLNRSEHLRARFREEDGWSGTWLVP